MDRLEDEFAQSAILHAKYSEEGASEAANKEHDNLLSIAQKIALKTDRGESTFLSLLRHANPYVVTWAGKYLLSLNPTVAETALQKICEGKGVSALNAKMVLQEWKKGALR